MLPNAARFYCCILVFCAVQLRAQECTHALLGRVIDESGNALPGATVLLTRLQRGTVTDVNGYFEINNLCAGAYELDIQFVGFRANALTVQLPQKDHLLVRMMEDLTELEELVVKDKADPIENARNFTQMTAQDFQATAGKTLGESLKELAGVSSIQAGPGIFKPVIHGVHSLRILILNNGIRQEGQQWGAEHAPEIDPFIASSITVIKDASAIKYGSDAIGGVIIVSPPALPTQAGLKGSFQTIAQSNGRSGTVAATLEGGLPGVNGFGWRLQSSARKSGDFQTPTYSLTNTGLQELNFSVATGYHREHLGVEVFFSHFSTEVGILRGTAIGNLEDLRVAMEADVPAGTQPFSYRVSEPRQVVSHDLLKVNGHWHGALGDWKAQYGFQNNQRQEFDVRIGSLSKLPAIDLQLFSHSLEAEWESPTHETHRFNAGFTGMYQDNNNIPGTQRIPFIPNYSTLAAGVFGVGAFYWKNVSMDMGVRYDFKDYTVAGYDFKNTLYRSNLTFHNVSATAGLTVEIDPQQSVSTSLSTAWRPPHVAELFSLGTHQSAAAIEYGLFLNDTTNEVMKPEQVNFQNEKAVKWVSTYRLTKSRWQVELSPYLNFIYNYFYLRPTGVTQNVRGTYPYFRYTQTNAFFAGFDATATWRVLPQVQVGPRVSYLRAEDASNNDFLLFIPSNRVEFTIRYDGLRSVWKGFYSELRLRYVAKQHRAPRVISIASFQQAIENDTDPLNGSSTNFDFLAAPGDYFLAGIGAGYSHGVKKARFDYRVSIENLFNERYREYTNRFRYYADELGRNVLLSAKCTF